jgi:ribonuclease BN (tRNA processing enzyme)
MDTFFDVQSIGVKGRFEWQGINFQLVQVIHLMNGFNFVHSYGLLFNINGVTIFFTSDTQFAPTQLMKFYDKADVIFHDCEISKFASGVHSHYNMLKTLDEKHKHKMWLYHYQPGERPDAVADGFKGFAVKGQVFNFA